MSVNTTAKTQHLFKGISPGLTTAFIGKKQTISPTSRVSAQKKGAQSVQDLQVGIHAFSQDDGF